MISFLSSIAILIIGYFVLSRVCARIFGADHTKETPSQTMADGVDYVPLPLWKSFLIQFLNIAGLGPIFGAVAGAMWGPVAFLWIVLGSLFAGGVHDYFSGMLSLRHKGENITELTGRYLGNRMKLFMALFSVVLLIMVGTVFIMGPAKILVGITGGDVLIWVGIIIVYYILSTLLPIDKLIGRIYPVFGVALLFMAVGILFIMMYHNMAIPEITFCNLKNMHYKSAEFPVFPFVFVTIACGAISGFHATQSPMMARCMTNERQGRPVFFGAMVTEGIVALIWAAISMSFFGGVDLLNSNMAESGGNAALVVNLISNSLLGKVGGVLAILGVVAAPITSGDTAFRSARLIIADLVKLKQGSFRNRLFVAAPLFIISIALLNMDFAVIWRYFAWTNQTMATIVLWAITSYLISHNKFYWVSLVPAVFMTAVVTTYILIAPEGFHLPAGISQLAGLGAAIFACIVFSRWISNRKAATSAVHPVGVIK